MMNKIVYANAYYEIYKIIENMPLEYKNNVPKEFINYIKEYMNVNHIFKYDITKDFLNQDIMIETKALLVNIYKNFLAKPEEKAYWDKYTIECINIAEENKIKIYNNSGDKFYSKNTFMSNNNNVKMNQNKKIEEKCELPVVIKKNSLFEKVKEVFKRLLKNR